MMPVPSLFLINLFTSGTHFYQAGHGSLPVVISGIRMGTFTVPGGLMQ